MAVISAFVILAGQSNALGFKITPAELPAYATPADEIKIWDGAKFTTMRPGVNTNSQIKSSPTAWGPEVAFAHLWRRDHPGEILYILKTTEGLTGLAADPSQWDWSPASRNEQWDKATRAIQLAKAQIPGAPLSAVLFMGGESDAIEPAKDRAFAANLASFSAHVRREWGTPSTPIILARISDEWGPASNVRKVQSQRGAFSTDAFSMQDDGRHFSGEGALALGEAFYKAFKKLSPQPAK